MIKEIIKWEPFPRKLPKKMLGSITKVVIDRGNGVEFATLDYTVPNKLQFFLECKGVLGGTIIEDINEIMFIAFCPIGPFEQAMMDEKKKSKKEKNP